MWVESQGSDMGGFALSLTSDHIKGVARGNQGDRHAREVLLEAEQRHVHVLGRDLDRTANATGALRGHQRGPAAAKGLKHDLAFIGVCLDDLARQRDREQGWTIEVLADL